MPPRRSFASLSPEQRGGGFAALAGLAALIVAWIAEHLLSLAPCALCLMERWPYRGLALFGLLGLLTPPPVSRLLAWAIALCFVCAIVLSCTHVGVEQGWWPDPWPACMAPTFHGGSMAERLASMPLRPVKPCDSPSRLFDFLPISMTTLDLLYALLTAALFAVILRRRGAAHSGRSR